MTPERKKQLDDAYAKAIRNATKEETTYEWRKYLATLWREDGNLLIFHDLRARPRSNGARLDMEYLAGDLTPREFINGLKTRCANAYTLALNRYGLAAIDLESDGYRQIIKTVCPEVLEAFEGVDPNDDTACCVAMAKTWHRLVELVHRAVGLPESKALRKTLTSDSDAETTVLDADDFESRMTAQKRQAWERQIEAVAASDDPILGQ